MATKQVRVELVQGAGFRTECTAGRHTVLIDQPVPAGGTDAGPTPLDLQLAALGGCIAAIGRIVVNQRRLPVRGFRITVTGELDTDRLLGKPSPKRCGFAGVTVQVAVDGDMTPAEKAALVHEIDTRCPISDNLQNPTPVTVALAG